jgi:hypothetical protein
MTEIPSTTSAAAPFTDADSGFGALVALITHLGDEGLDLEGYNCDEVANRILQSRWLQSVRANPDIVIDAPAPAERDLNSMKFGLSAPFDYWEHDYTGLVHVLWSLRHYDRTLLGGDDAEEVAATLIASRWLVALRAETRIRSASV